MADAIGARWGSVGDAVEHGDVVVVSVPWPTLDASPPSSKRPAEGNRVGHAGPRHGRRLLGMCRNITELRGLEPPATREEIEAAARQYIRKVSGIAKPSDALAGRMEDAAL